MSITTASAASAAPHTSAAEARPQVIRRDGSLTEFDASRISTAVHKAFLDVEGSDAGTSSRVRETVATVTDDVVTALLRRTTTGRPLHIEDIQDQVELALMRGDQYQVARSYVLYREEHARAREARQKQPDAPPTPSLNVKLADGSTEPFDIGVLRDVIAEACRDCADASPDAVLKETERNLYDGMSLADSLMAPVMAARALVETEPDYSFVAAWLLLRRARIDALPYLGLDADASYERSFTPYVERGIEIGQLDGELARFNLDRLAAAIKPERDNNFGYLGLQTLYDRYLLHHKGIRYELPQAFFMRVAMGLAVREVDREARAIEFYDLLSSFDFMCSTPTLFNAGTIRPQLSSCFLTTVDDDLNSIFGGIRNNALLSKYAGGLGNDWTPVRGLGAHIRGTNGQSQGVVPFLKIANDTAVAVNQGGKRKGAACAYLETWHIDIEEFLDLRKNTGDDRRRTHDMNTANWVPDLFMQRVTDDAEWTLFSPDEVPDLHETYGEEFARRYVEHEARAARGEIAVYRTVRAVDLWRRMLSMLFETGHPWITFKDPCNIRSPQQHVGVVHSSNLCTEITLNTTVDEVAVCNLGSVNLAAHVDENGLDLTRLEHTVTTAVRMLDNVVDVNLYTIPETRRSNLKHRPVGLGLMGFQDALYKMRVTFDQADGFADESMEAISYFAIAASSDLAAERGRYPSYDGSLWSQGILPIDSLELLAQTREIEVDRSARLDWSALRTRVQAQGMRNSNVMAIAPTATISNICGVSQSIEPTYRNLYVKANMSGDFTSVNPYLVRDLKARGLWDSVMVSDLKYFDGALAPIDRVPEDLKALYATAFEIDPSWLVAAAARRQKWIDQAQSLNLYVGEPSGRKLDELYRLAWRRGLKTTYYLRTQSATHVEKSTLATTDGKLNAVAAEALPSAEAGVSPAVEPAAPACSIEDPECEACQ